MAVTEKYMNINFYKITPRTSSNYIDMKIPYDKIRETTYLVNNNICNI